MPFTRSFFLWVFGTILFALASPSVAQDSLSFNPNPLTLTQSSLIDAFAPIKWRLSGTLGFHRQYETGYLNESLYLTNGPQFTLATDYFIGRHWGLGIQLGYQSLAVSDQYRADPSIPKSPSPVILPLTSLHSFMLTAGPAFSFPLSQRLDLDMDFRGGVFYNDAPILGAYTFGSKQGDVLTGVLVTTITPNSQRAKGGLIGSIGFKYQLTQQFSMGLALNGSYSSFGYTQVNSTNNFAQRRVDLTMYGIQFGMSYRFLSSQRQRSTSVPLSAPKPVCYPPVLEQTPFNEYEIGTTSRPVFKWRSSAPIYTEGERFTFRLYTLPGNKLVYERTGRETQLTWPTQLALPDTSSYYFYSVYTLRNDELEQTCTSEPVVGTFGFYKRTVAQPQVVREPARLYTLRLYELRAIPVAKSTRPLTSVSKATSTTTSSSQPKQGETRADEPDFLPIIQSDSLKTDLSALIKLDSSQSSQLRLDSTRLAAGRSDSIRSDSARSDLARRDSVRADSIQADSTRRNLAKADSIRSTALPSSMRIGARLVVEIPVLEPEFIWPGRAPFPTRPTVYQYIISRTSTQQILQNQYIMVEPDGCTTNINEATRNKYIQYSTPPREQPTRGRSSVPTGRAKPKRR